MSMVIKICSRLVCNNQQMKIWHDNDDYCSDDRLIGWGESYQKCKAEKVSIKEELLPIAWHPSRHWDWCATEDEKKEVEKFWT